MPGIIGKKLGMSQIIQDDGRVIPVTFIKCDTNTIVQVKTDERDGYPAIVLGFDAYNKPTKNKKFKVLKEFRVESVGDFKVDQEVKLDTFSDAEKITIVSDSKGKGFQGVVKRHNFAMGPNSHGSHHHREPGSIGMCAHPARVLKGKKMPGQMGNQKVTLKNRSVIAFLPEKNLSAIKCPVPGANNGYVYLQA